MGNKEDTPNQVALSSRLIRIIGATTIIAYGLYGLFADDLILPAKRGALHLHGLPSWVMIGAMLCAALGMLSVVVDHYDQRNNETSYKLFGKWSSRIGWVLFAAALGLHLARIQYPRPSDPTTFSIASGSFMFLVTMFFAFWKEKAIVKAQRIEAKRSGSGTNSGRILGIVLIIFGTPLLILSLPGLVQFDLKSNVIASIAVFTLAFGFFSFRFKPLLLPVRLNESDDLPAKWLQSQKPVSKALPLRIGFLLLLGIWLIWYMHIAQMGKSRWQDEDEIQRTRSPAWNYSIDDLRYGISVETINKQLSALGFRVKCYGNLQAQEKVDPTDTHVCWTIANNIDGIPSHMITFQFGIEGLNHVTFDFPKEQWPAVLDWFKKQNGRDAGNFGRDHDGSQVIGRRLDTGLILTSQPKAIQWVMVTWDARERVIERECNAQGLSNSQRLLICREWSKPASASRFQTNATN